MRQANPLTELSLPAKELSLTLDELIGAIAKRHTTRDDIAAVYPCVQDLEYDEVRCRLLVRSSTKSPACYRSSVPSHPARQASRSPRCKPNNVFRAPTGKKLQARGHVGGTFCRLAPIGGLRQ